MTIRIYKFLVAVLVIALIFSGAYFWKNFKALAPGITKPQKEVVATINTTGVPLALPEGFSAEIFAKNLPGARVIVFGPNGTVFVSQTSQGKITLLQTKNSKVVQQTVFLSGLNKPHGLAIDPKDPFSLFVAEETKISKIKLFGDAPAAKLDKIADLPKGGLHFTRTLGFGPDNKLYVSIGSSCNVCDENDPRYASVYSLNRDGSDFKKIAGGLRNTVFFTWSYVDGKMWATENGRDRLGDDLPADEINIIEAQRNYGWPNCYGQNIHDVNFDKKIYIRNPCEQPFSQPSKVDLQAHSAPLGLSFVPEEGWPQKYWYNLLVTYHGSWNRTVPTGYKIVRVILDQNSNYRGTENFITGWRDNNNVFGRPVDIVAQPGGILYVSDDKAGVIYKIWYDAATVPANTNISAKIFVASPAPNSIITSPVEISGKAVGNWFFEASFPAVLEDADGNILAQKAVQALTDWMTTDFVPFRAELSFPKPKTAAGKLILKKDNPSGLPENEAQIEVPVKFY